MTKPIPPQGVLRTGVLALSMALVFLASAAGLPPLPEGSDCFTIAVFGDTQAYSGTGEGVSNPSFASRVDWLSNADNLRDQNILFVSHQGDIVDRKEIEGQWQFASAQMAKLDGVVPYGISPGNHDIGGAEAPKFQQYFPASRYEGNDWYGESFSGIVVKTVSYYGNNANSYQLFSWKNQGYIVFHIQCNAGPAVLDWVNDLLDGPYADRKAIIVTHMYLGAIEEDFAGKCAEPSQRLLGRMRWRKAWAAGSMTPCESWQYCYARHRNIILILCGDQSEALSYRQASRGMGGNIVHEICMDYPHSDTDDWIRLYRFFPEEGRIEAYTYSPAADSLCTSAGYCTDEKFHRFTLTEEPAASIGDVLVRQQWPWTATIHVDYTLSSPGGGRYDVTPIVKEGETEIAVPAAAASGDLLSVEAGRHALELDTSRLAFAGDPAKLTVTLALTPAAGEDNEVLYRLVSLRGDQTVIDLSRADIKSGRWGSYMDSGADYRAWIKDFASKSDVLESRGLFIWTGVTNSMAYRTDWLVLRRIPAGQDIQFTENNITARITKDYWMGVFEYTQGQYEQVHKVAYELHYSASIPKDYDNDYYKQMHFTNALYAAGRPVDKVSWSDICGGNGRHWPTNITGISNARYLGQLRMVTGLNFFLPTELQWEYGVGARSTTDFCTGYDWYGSNSKEVLSLIGRWKDNGGLIGGSTEPDRNCTDENGTAVVGSYIPSPWGIYDGQGNVKEWVMDRNASLSDLASAAEEAGGKLVDWPGSATTDWNTRIIRNGSYAEGASYSKLRTRAGMSYNNGKSGYGFRVVLAMNDKDVVPGLAVSDEIPVSVAIDETAVWRTAPGSAFEVPCYWPEGATRAVLSASADGESVFEPITVDRIGLDIVTNIAVALGEPVASPVAERTVDLTLDLKDSSGQTIASRTTRLGQVEGFGGAPASVRKPASLRKRTGPSAVLQVPQGVSALTLDGTSVDTGLSGAAGWYWWHPIADGKHEVAVDGVDPVWITAGIPGLLLLLK